MTHARTHAHTRTCNYTHAHAHSHRHSPDRPDRCIDPPAVCSSPPSWSPLPMRAWTTPASTSLHSLQLLHRSHNKQTTAANSVQWTLQLLVSDARTECTGSLSRARLARRGYRFALFSDAQGTPSLRIRVGQRGQPGNANKCSASRIRRRSRQHRAQTSALGGPMKDRLYRDGLLRW